MKRIISLSLMLVSMFAAGSLSAQTYPVMPAPNHDSDHDAFVTGTITVNGSTQKIAGAIAKLSRVNAGPTYVPVSYDITDADGNFTLSGQSGVTYIVTYEYPTSGFSVTSGNPSTSFSVVAGANVAPNGGLALERLENTITNCNMSSKKLTDWKGTIDVPKAVAINNAAVLSGVSVFGSVAAAHPIIEVTATTASTIKLLEVGALVQLSGPAGYSDVIDAVKTFAKQPTAQNINLAASQTLSYYDISSALSSTYNLSGTPVEYTGTGDVTFDIIADASKTISLSGGNTSSTEQTFASAGVCLTYTYTFNPLPVKLASFTATAEGKVANLNWVTTSESNSERFDIERSKDAKTWSKIGSVLSKGESQNLSQYSFSDHLPFNGQNFYRLKMIDRAADRNDGTFAYSRIRTVEIGNGNIASVYPNPVSDYLKLNVNPLQRPKNVSLTGMNGKLVFASNDLSQISNGIDVRNLNPGTYFVSMKYANGYIETQKIAIVK